MKLESTEAKQRQRWNDTALAEGILWGMLPGWAELVADDVWDEIRKHGVQVRSEWAVMLALREFAKLHRIENTGRMRYRVDWRGQGREQVVWTTMVRGFHRPSDEECRWQRDMAVAEYLGLPEPPEPEER